MWEGEDETWVAAFVVLEALMMAVAWRSEVASSCHLALLEASRTSVQTSLAAFPAACRVVAVCALGSLEEEPFEAVVP